MTTAKSTHQDEGVVEARGLRHRRSSTLPPRTPAKSYAAPIVSRPSPELRADLRSV